MYPLAIALHNPHAPVHPSWFQATTNLLSVSIDLWRLAFKLRYGESRAVNLFPLPRQDPSEDQLMHHTLAGGNGKYSQSLVSFGNCLETTSFWWFFLPADSLPSRTHGSVFRQRLKGALLLILTCPPSFSLSPSLCLSSIFCLLNPSCLSLPEFPCLLNSGRMLGSVWVFPPWSAALKLPPGTKLRQSQGSLHLFPFF